MSQAVRFGLFDRENKGAVICRNVGKYLPFDKAEQSVRQESSQQHRCLNRNCRMTAALQQAVWLHSITPYCVQTRSAPVVHMTAALQQCACTALHRTVCVQTWSAPVVHMTAALQQAVWLHSITPYCVCSDAVCASGSHDCSTVASSVAAQHYTVLCSDVVCASGSHDCSTVAVCLHSITPYCVCSDAVCASGSQLA